MVTTTRNVPEYKNAQKHKYNYPSGDPQRGVFQVSFPSFIREHNLKPYQRYINKLAINSFGFTTQSAWEGVGLSFQFAWLNGGPAAIVYGSLIAGIGSSLVAMALGEMAAMKVRFCVCVLCLRGR